jgi:hypothetical protein
MPKKRPQSKPAGPGEVDRVTYRELRNTPGRVWERLADGGPLTLVADGEAKGILIPLAGDDPRTAYEAYTRGRSLLAAARIRQQSRASGTNRTSLEAINAMIREVRRERNRASRSD